MSTTNRGYATPATGTEVGTWGGVLNANFALIDSNLGGVATVPLTNVNVTLNSTQASNGTIRFTGTLTGNVTITFPSVQAWYSIDNQTTGAFYVLLTCGGGNNIAIEQGAVTDILTDGSNTKFRNLPPVGSYLDVADATVPIWITACSVPPFLNCDGTTFSAVTYPYLNTKLGGNTLPNFKGTAAFYLNQGSGNITTAGSGIDGNTRFSTGGAQTVTLLTGNLPPYTPSGSVSSSLSATVTILGVQQPLNFGGAGNTYFNNTGQTTTLNVVGSVSSSFSGSAQGGQSTPTNKMPPATISGLRLIRAA